MKHTWYVTFEVPKEGRLIRRRRSRSTSTFETETDAKNFARLKFGDGLIVTAGTIVPHLPRCAIASASIPSWLEQGNEQEIEDPDRTADQPEKTK